MPWLVETALFLLLGSSLMVAYFSGIARAQAPAHIRVGSASQTANRNNTTGKGGA
uniref:hypothetical protein n=1 Tax=Pararhizobium sp. IMCC3301 TaxID=3067904 RepID=UPI002742681F|nr:hypothetical protein [Pararhizobium sp. IMCC3301]